MLYAKLQNIRNLKKEVDFWKKELQNAESKITSTKGCSRVVNKISLIELRVKEATKQYQTSLNDVLKHSDFQQMEKYLQDICNSYYFNAESENSVKVKYTAENFMRDIRNYCHKIK